MQIGYFIDTNIPALFIDLNCHYNNKNVYLCISHTHHILWWSMLCVGDDGSHLLTNGQMGSHLLTNGQM